MSDFPPPTAARWALEAVLFAAGLGERLRPLTEVCPKPALPLLDVPLGLQSLTRVLEVRSPVVVNAAHLADRVLSALELDHRAGDVEVLIEAPEPYGTAGTLAELRPQLGRTVLTWNSDMLTDLSPRRLLDEHVRIGAIATVAVAHDDTSPDFEFSGQRATRFMDRRASNGGKGVRFIGAGVFERAALDRLPRRRPSGLGEALLGPLADAGELAVVVHEGYALDVGTIERYLRASEDVLYGRGPGISPEPPGEIIEVKGGRAYVGPHANVDPESLGAGAIVLGGARVEAGARIADAIVWPKEIVPAGARISEGVWFRGTLIKPVTRA
ncbi:MAG: NDP-sugar synthase [Actinomycetota bacterium]|nr:NDP-sugar synthase [Actinomycetota bacterium]